MRILRLAAAVLATGFSLAAAAAPGPEALVDAERGFARDAATTSVRDAFVKWLAPSAVVFNPGPVNGRKLYESRKPSPTRLAWEPVFAVMGSGGDLGWTTGPWQWRADSTNAEPQAWGHYVTLWKRQPEGHLLAVLDLGVSHGDPGPLPALQARSLAGTTSSRGPLAQRHALWKADADFAKLALSQGVAPALAAVAAPEIRLMHDGAFPVIGRDAARDTAAARHAKAKLMSLAQFIADSGDVGYTYGTFVERRAAGSDSSYYLHIWQREAGRPWQLALELISPVPPAKK